MKGKTMNRNYYFKQALLKMGIADTRVESIADAGDQLHHAVSCLDERNYNLFMSAFSKTLNLVNAYAECEELRKFKSSITKERGEHMK
jgi:hypothetical protein